MAGKLIAAVGAVVSIVQLYDAALLVSDPETASTEKLCEPAESPEYAFGLVQAAKAAASSEHLKLTPLVESVNENDADADADGFAGFAVIDGVAGPLLFFANV